MTEIIDIVEPYITGPQGAGGTIESATAVGLAPGAEPTVTLGGTPEQRTIEFGIPEGEPGTPATITSATAETLPPQSDATVTVGGTPSARTFAFGIPKGDPGSGSVSSVNGDLGPDVVLDAGDVGAATPTELSNAIESLRQEMIGTPDLIGALRYPVYIAHRGSLLAYPEHSWEAYRASYEAGFSPEADVVALADGTLVCLHDTTTNRTMDISKPVNTVTVDEWRKATINPPVRQAGRIVGTRRGTPVFFEDYLDEFGGKVVLWPEIKVASIAPSVITAVTDRRLHRSVVLQSSSFSVMQQIKAAGLPALMLGTSATPAQLEAEGVEFVGLNASASQSFINDCIARGIKVIGYTHNTKADAEAQLAKGMVGVFSDDPWEVSREFTPRTYLNLEDALPPIASHHSRSNSTRSYGPGTSQHVVVRNNKLYFYSYLSDNTTTGANSLKIGQFGYGGPSAKVRLWVQSHGALEQTNWLVGVYLGEQLGDVAINEEPDESRFRLCMIRRDGRKHVYEKRTYTSDVEMLESTAATTPPYAPPDGRSIPMLFEFEFYANRVAMRNLTLNDTGINVTHTPWSDTGDLYICIATSASVSSVWDVSCERN